nr:hypothetical protein [Mycobacterium sp. 012931]
MAAAPGPCGPTSRWRLAATRATATASLTARAVWSGAFAGATVAADNLLSVQGAGAAVAAIAAGAADGGAHPGGAGVAAPPALAAPAAVAVGAQAAGTT